MRKHSPNKLVCEVGSAWQTHTRWALRRDFVLYFVVAVFRDSYIRLSQPPSVVNNIFLIFNSFFDELKAAAFRDSSFIIAL